MSNIIIMARFLFQSRVVLVASSITQGLSQGVTHVPLATTRMRVNSLIVNRVLMRPLQLPKEVKHRETAEVYSFVHFAVLSIIYIDINCNNL